MFFSIYFAYQTVKTDQLSNVNALVVEKYKTDLLHVEECVISIQKMDSEIDLGNKVDLPTLATLEYFKSELTGIENSIELYLNEENEYCYKLQKQIKNNCDNLDNKLTIAKDYRKNYSTEEEDGLIHKGTLTKTDGPGIPGDRIRIANNRELMKEYIEYSKEERNSFPSRFRAYIDKFKKKDNNKN